MSRIDFVTGAPERYMPLVRDLTLVPDRVDSLLRRHSGADLRRAEEGEWTAERVLAHMISYAHHSGDFIRQIAWMTEPVLQPWDESSEIADAAFTGDAALETFRSALAETIDLLSHTPDAQWGRPGLVPLNGRESLRQYVRWHIEHLNEHISQLESVLTS